MLFRYGWRRRIIEQAARNRQTKLGDTSELLFWKCINEEASRKRGICRLIPFREPSLTNVLIFDGDGPPRP